MNVFLPSSPQRTPGAYNAQVLVSGAALLRFAKVLPRDPVLRLRAAVYRGHP